MPAPFALEPDADDVRERAAGLGQRLLRHIDLRSFVYGVCFVVAGWLVSHAGHAAHKPRRLPAFSAREPPLPSFAGVPLAYDKLALMVETRTPPQLVSLLLHFTMVVPSEWPFRFVGSAETLEYLRARPSIRHLERARKLHLATLGDDWHMDSAESVSRSLTNISFYDTYAPGAERLLIFQPDSILCSRSNISVNDFAAYDWVGAPWRDQPMLNGGNGGLSLRRISRIRRALEHGQRPFDDFELSDLWLCHRLLEFEDHRVADYDTEKRWAVESIPYESPKGYHIGHDGLRFIYDTIWYNDDTTSRIYRHCPEIKQILRGMTVVDP